MKLVKKCVCFLSPKVVLANITSMDFPQLDVLTISHRISKISSKTIAVKTSADVLTVISHRISKTSSKTITVKTSAYVLTVISHRICKALDNKFITRIIAQDISYAT